MVALMRHVGKSLLIQMVVSVTGGVTSGCLDGSLFEKETNTFGDLTFKLKQFIDSN